jgi:CRP-like cAMP-binding protein
LWEDEPQNAPDVLREKFAVNLYPLFRDTVLALFAKGGPEERLNTVEKLHHLAASRLFGLLATRDLERLSLFASERTFAPGEQIFADGDAATELYLIASGSVRVGLNSNAAHRTAGAVLGEECLFGHTHRGKTAVSEGVNVLVLRRSDVLRSASVSSRIGVELLGWRLDKAYALEA